MQLRLINSVFKHLSDRELSVLTSNATLLEFDREEMFLKHKSLLFSVYFIEQGEVKLKDEDNLLFSILGKGDFLGLSSITHNSPIEYSAYATPHTRIVQLEKSVINKFMLTNSAFLNGVLQKIEEDIKHTIFNFLSYRKNKIHGALASFLLYYSEKNCLKELKRREIGEMLGYSRENVTKALRTFLKEGYITMSKNEIKIANSKALETLKKIG